MTDADFKQEAKPVCKNHSQQAGSLFGHRTLVVGLTGGVATGKTTVAHMLQRLGACVISADEIVHELLQPGTEVYREVVGEFGNEILADDGTVDRARLADIVFRDARKRRRLEEIVHPPVLTRIAEQIERFRTTGHGILVVEIPLLIETSSVGMVDKVLVVTAEQETQIGRLVKRYGVTHEEALLRIRSQLPMSEKVKYADWVVSTEGTISHTEEQVQRVWDLLQKAVAQPM